MMLTKHLKKALKSALVAVYTESDRTNIQHIHCPTDAQRLVSTDGHRLHILDTGPDVQIPPMLIHRRTAEALIRLCDNSTAVEAETDAETETVRWSFDAARVTVTVPARPTTCPYYPDWRQVIPTGQAVASAFYTRAEWYALLQEQAETIVHVPGFDGIPPTYARASYLRDALRACGGARDKITIRLHGPLDPIVISSTTTATICVVMPCKEPTS